MEWRTDLGSAPRGRTVESVSYRGGSVVKTSTFHPERILLSIIDDGEPKVICSYRTEPNRWSPDGRWAGCADTQKIVGWMPMPKPMQETGDAPNPPRSIE